MVARRRRPRNGDDRSTGPGAGPRMSAGVAGALSGAFAGLPLAGQPPSARAMLTGRPFVASRSPRPCRCLPPFRSATRLLSSCGAPYYGCSWWHCHAVLRWNPAAGSVFCWRNEPVRHACLIGCFPSCPGARNSTEFAVSSPRHTVAAPKPAAGRGLLRCGAAKCNTCYTARPAIGWPQERKTAAFGVSAGGAFSKFRGNSCQWRIIFPPRPALAPPPGDSRGRANPL